MREIKFRCWDKEQKIMGSLIEFSQLGANAYAATTLAKWYDNDGDIDGFYDRQGKLILLQYTGLNDERGNEVYEYDIVWCPWKDEKFIVEWDEIGTGYLFHNVNDKKRTHGIDYYEFEDTCASLGFEVIGNIYENPELLEGATNG